MSDRGGCPSARFIELFVLGGYGLQRVHTAYMVYRSISEFIIVVSTVTKIWTRVWTNFSRLFGG